MRPSSAKVHLFVWFGEYTFALLWTCLPSVLGPEKNFSPQEKGIILAAMKRYYDRLHGARSKDTSKGRRDEILQRITDQVNAVGEEAQTHHQEDERSSQEGEGEDGPYDEACQGHWWWTCL